MIEINLKPEKKKRKFSFVTGLPLKKWPFKSLVNWKNRRILKKEPSSSFSHVILGEEYLEKGIFDLAKVQFMTAARIAESQYFGPGDPSIELSCALKGISLCANSLSEKVELLAKAYTFPDIHSYTEEALFGSAQELARRYGMEYPEVAACLFMIDIKPFSKQLHRKYLQITTEQISNPPKDKDYGRATVAVAFYRAAMEINPEFYHDFFIEALQIAGISKKDAVEEANKFKKQEKEDEKNEESKVNPPDKYKSCVPSDEVRKYLVGDVENEGNLAEKVEKIRKEDARFKALIANRYTGIHVFEDYARFLVDSIGFLDEGDAEKSIKMLVERCPLSADVNFQYGRLLYRNDTPYNSKRFEADTYFFRAFELDPDLNPGHVLFHRTVQDNYLAKNDLGKRAIAVKKEEEVNDNLDASYFLFHFKAEYALKGSEGNLDSAISRASLFISGDKELAAVQTIVKMGKEQEVLDSYPVDGKGKVAEDRPGKSIFPESDSTLKKVMECISYREHVESIAKAKKSGNPLDLAKELALVGLYDDAIEAAKSAEDMGMWEYQTIGDCYESKWMKYGNQIYLEKAYEAYSGMLDALEKWYKRIKAETKVDPFHPKIQESIFSSLENMGRIAAQLGIYSELERSAELAEEIIDEPMLGICGFYTKYHIPKFGDDVRKEIRQDVIKMIRLYKQAEPFHLQRLREALSQPDLEKKIEILEEVEENVPGAAHQELNKAYKEYASQLGRKLKEPCGAV